MRERITNPDIPPRGGWKYFIAPLGLTVTGKDPGELVRNVRRAFRGNSLPVPENLAEDIEKSICDSGVVKCSKARNSGLWVTMRNGTRALVHALKSAVASGESVRVPQEEANRRARICASCPLNVPVSSGCKSCSGAAAVLENRLRTGARLLGAAAGLRTPYDNSLKSCATCGCELRLKVHIAHFAAIQPPPDLQLPENCWLKES